MLEYNRIRWEIDGLSEPITEPTSHEPEIRMLQHFDYPETWSFEGNAWLSRASKFGKSCASFLDTTGKAICTNTTGMYKLSANGAYEAECFVKADLSGLGGSSVEELEQVEQDLTEEGYKFYGGHTFKYYSDSLTWSEAKLACEALGGHLATSTSAEKNAFLVSIASATSWLGGTEEDGVGLWKWVTGEEWSYTNWANGEPRDYADEIYVAMYKSASDKTDGTWNDDTATNKLAYVCEWDYDMLEEQIGTGNLLSFGDELTLGIRSDGKITLQSEIWSLDEISTVPISTDTWHHILLRISGGVASVYLDGALALSVSVSGTRITPENLELGGFVGYIDEFVFRDGAGTGNPTVPTVAYETSTSSTGTTGSNAPVTRAVWTCEDLPEGLTLSADGKLSGRPTVAGTYTSTVNVTTNWGTASKTINIRVTG